MAVAFRASAVGGAGQSATTSTISITIPGTAVAGDVAALAVSTSGNTVTTPTGWTLRSGPDAATSTDSYLYTKTLVSGDVGASLTLTCSAAGRFLASMIVVSGATETGAVFGTVAGEASGTTPTLPSVASVPANSIVVAFITRRRGGTPAPTITYPNGGYTTTGGVTTGYGAAPEFATLGGYKIITTSGTYGGDVEATDTASVGNNYLIGFPPATTLISRLKIGSSLVDSIKVGSSTCAKVYVGSTQIWP